MKLVLFGQRIVIVLQLKDGCYKFAMSAPDQKEPLFEEIISVCFGFGIVFANDPWHLQHRGKS